MGFTGKAFFPSDEAGCPCDFVVTCKRCREAIPAPIQTMPDTWIVVICPLCGDTRRYLPAQIYRGMMSHRIQRRIEERE
jgi:hypothetical protein